MRTALRKKSTLAVAAVAALTLSLTACNDGSGTKDSGAADSTNSATASTAPDNSSESSGSSASTDGKPEAEAGGDKSDTGSADSGGASEQDGTSTGADGEGVNTGGGEGTYTGTLTYLADHKMMVGDQAFLIDDTTAILGAAAICGAPDGSVSADNTGAGTLKCTYDDLVKAAKTGSVKVKVLKDSDGIAVKVAEIYHP
ncbi:hypothetical protein [Streptomyces kanamyceticus]|uniref:Lipoprotein n=1 Tax=Streptomyces kanamyceticus TaxID=1967 RepID=A0A5J6GBD3_STRKN|nr:hypothetical protein [Streptomyces kanamyceticus]QEU91295.1 hypothetical protein CP970_10720 [Streptomyces kanamyceticus]